MAVTATVGSIVMKRITGRWVGSSVMFDGITVGAGVLRRIVGHGVGVPQSIRWHVKRKSSAHRMGLSQRLNAKEQERGGMFELPNFVK